MNPSNLARTLLWLAVVSCTAGPALAEIKFPGQARAAATRRHALAAAHRQASTVAPRLPCARVWNTTATAACPWRRPWRASA